MEMLADAEPTDELLRNSIKLYFRFLKHNPEIVRVLAWMFLERDQEDCLQKDRALVEAGLAQIRAGQAVGYLRRDIDARFVLFVFLGLAQHWFQDKEHFIRDFDPEGLPKDLDEAYLSDMLKIFMEGVLPR
jgi:TetR/AcrR family transcriptional regulator